MCLFGKNKEKKEDVYRGLVCPFCFAKFDGDQVHFRRRPELNVKENFPDDKLKAYLGETTDVNRREVYEPYETGKLDKVHYQNEPVGKLVRKLPVWFEQPNGMRTREILCPHCHNKLTDTTLRGKSKAISILGYTQIGKTHYIISLLQYLNERACYEATGDLNVTWLHGRDKYEKQRKQYLHNELGATNRGEKPEPIVLRLTRQGREVTLSFFDFPGESDLRDISGLKHFENADAYMVLFDLTKTETFRFLSIEQQIKDVEEQRIRLGNQRNCLDRILQRMRQQFEAYLSSDGCETKHLEWGNILQNTEQKQIDAARVVLKGLFENLYLGEQTYYYNALKDNLLLTNANRPSAHGDATVDLTDGLHPAAKLVGMPDNQPQEVQESEFVRHAITELETSGLRLCGEFANREITDMYDFLKNEIWQKASLTAKHMGARIAQLKNLREMLQANNGELRDPEAAANNNGINALQNLGEWIENRLLEGVQDDRSLKQKPIAFVGTKSDEVIRILDMLSKKESWEPYSQFDNKIDGFLQRIALHKTALQPSRGVVQPNGAVVTFREYYNPEHIEEMHVVISQMLWSPGQPEHAYLEARGICPPRGGMDTKDRDKVKEFAIHRMFAVSALGTYYEVNEWGETQRHAAQTDMQMANVVQPLYWLLHELGFFDV